MMAGFVLLASLGVSCLVFIKNSEQPVKSVVGRQHCLADQG